MGGPAVRRIFLSTDYHFEFAVEDKGDLFVGVAVFKQPATFFYFPDGEGAFVPVNHFPKKTRPDLFGRDVQQDTP